MKTAIEYYDYENDPKKWGLNEIAIYDKRVDIFYPLIFNCLDFLVFDNFIENKNIFIFKNWDKYRMLNLDDIYEQRR